MRALPGRWASGALLLRYLQLLQRESVEYRNRACLQKLARAKIEDEALRETSLDGFFLDTGDISS